MYNGCIASGPSSPQTTPQNPHTATHSKPEGSRARRVMESVTESQNPKPLDSDFKGDSCEPICLRDKWDGLAEWDWMWL